MSHRSVESSFVSFSYFKNMEESSKQSRISLLKLCKIRILQLCSSKEAAFPVMTKTQN